MVDPGLGNATPQETISPDLSATGLRVASREGSAFRTEAVVVIVFISCLSRKRKARRDADLPCVEPGPLRLHGSVHLVDDDLSVRHLRRILEDRASHIVEFYTRKDSRPNDAAYFENLARTLSSQAGEPYGHSGRFEELMHIGNTCVPAAGQSQSPPH